MKKNLLSLLFISSLTIVNAQNNLSKMDDNARIKLAAYVPPQIEEMPTVSRSVLQNKLSQIVTQNGLGGSALHERFIITANVSVNSKDITDGAPSMTVYKLDITFYIGDGYEGTKFASTSIKAKGVGETEIKAYNAAINSIRTSDPAFQQFIEQGKTRIIEYYNSKCDFILKEAQTLATQSKYEEALYKLTSVPEVCKDCYDKCAAAVGPIYKKQIDKDCNSKLSQAKNIWASTNFILLYHYNYIYHESIISIINISYI